MTFDWSLLLAFVATVMSKGRNPLKEAIADRHRSLTFQYTNFIIVHNHHIGLVSRVIILDPNEGGINKEQTT